ncbi:MAG: gliding motility-associated C-terminal domain-containing protein [Candidatus Marinimicrobia bacterium]|nr:gliding motility-associated C-terminal domain-containing protein [Candidatus Neomarinimicrobiota bacterium]
MARAFIDRGSECSAITAGGIQNDEIPSNYEFESDNYFSFLPIPSDDSYSGNSILEINKLVEIAKVGDIIVWGSRKGSSHAAFVINVFDYYNDPYRNIRIDHILNNSTELVEDVPLFDTKDSGYGKIVGVARKNPLWYLKVENNFGGGEVEVNGQSKTSGTILGPFHWMKGIHLTASWHGKPFGGSNQYFVNWQKTDPYSNDKDLNSSIYITLTDADFAQAVTYTANYIKGHEVYVENQFNDIGNKGYLTIDGIDRILPFTSIVVEDGDSIQVSAPLNPQTYNHIDYEFTHWSTGSEFHTITVTPTENMTITAHYEGKPKPMINYNFNLILNPGQKVKMSWNDHPNQNVTRYHIWRQIKYKNGWPRDSTLVSIVNRGTTNWTDPTYIVTSSYIVDLLEYDVRALYSSENTLAKDDWFVCFGKSGFLPKESIDQWDDLIPNEYILTQNFPNPFNPITRIGYALPEVSSVSLVIYDLRGNKVFDRYHEREDVGYKHITWNGKDQKGNPVPAGVYIYKLTAKSNERNQVFTQSRKMVILK